MAIAQVGSIERNFQSFGTSVSVNVPSGVLNGHVLVAAHFCWAATSTPTGWTLQREETWTAAGDGFTRWIRVYSRVAASEPASYAFTTAASDEHAAFISAWSGVDTANPLDATAVGQNTGNTQSASMTAPTFNTVTNGCEILMIGGVFNSDVGTGTSVTPPSGYTELLDYGNSWTLAYLARLSQAVAGSVAAATATISAAFRNGAVHLALRPASTATWLPAWATQGRTRETLIQPWQLMLKRFINQRRNRYGKVLLGRI